MSQEELAERAHLSVESISALERGRRRAPYRDTVRMLADGLRLSEPQRQELAAAVSRGNLQATPTLDATSAGGNNLPLTPTRFLGRERELAELRMLLDNERLVTLTGSGGIGKTRTALRAASEFLGCKGDGVWFVNLAPLTDPTLVPNTVAAALGIPVSGERPIAQTLLAALRAQQSLIVLDNCEHVVAAAAELANALVLACPRVNLLVTSREPLNISAERVYRVPSLALPPTNAVVTTADAAAYSAVALFVERAQAADAAFRLCDEIAPIVAEIVRRLDGIPLAIELAAARVSTLGIRALAQRLDQRFRLLTKGSRDALPRQQTLRALFDWSHDLLHERERVLFRRVAIFSGGWTLEAAEAVCSDDVLDETDIIDVLRSLVEKSLVTADVEADSVRYRLLESGRAYALEKLMESDERTTLADRHARWVRAFVERADEQGWTRPLRVCLAHVEPEADNIRGALAALLGAGDYELAGQIVGHLLEYWLHLARAEGRRWIDAAFTHLDAAVHPAVVSRLLICLAMLSSAQRKVEASARAISLIDRFGDFRTLAQANFLLAEGLLESGRLDEAAMAADRVLQILDSAGLARTRWYGKALLVRTLIRLGQRRLNDARTSCVAALTLAESLGDEMEVARAQVYLAEVEFSGGDARRALELLLQVKDICELNPVLQTFALANTPAYLLACGDTSAAQAAAHAALVYLRRTYMSEHDGLEAFSATCAILHLAAALALQGDAPRAARLLGFVNAWCLREGLKMENTEATSHKTLVAALESQLSASEIAEQSAAGAELDEEQAIDEALAATKLTV